MLLVWRTQACWGWLQSGPTQPESNSTTLRNVGLLVGAVVALVFAVWRGRVSERQTDIAQQSLLNERYQKGAEMLGSPILPVRLGGIYALQRLAEEHPQEYHVQVMRLLCAFARNSTQYDEDDNQASVQAAMFAIGSRENTSVAIEENAKYTSNLSSINLHRMPLSGMNFSRVNLSRSNLNGTMLFRTNLSGSYLL